MCFQTGATAGTARRQARRLGHSNVAGSVANDGRRGDNRRWQHNVDLQWEGYLDVQGDRLTHMVFAANGHEELSWGNPLAKVTTKTVIRNLPAGRTLDVDGGVRYGLIAVPCSADEVGEQPVRVRSKAAQQKRMALIRKKIQQVQQGLKRWRQQGKNPAPIGRAMEQFGALIKAGKINEANAVLDRALKLLADDRRPGADDSRR